MNPEQYQIPLIPTPNYESYEQGSLIHINIPCTPNCFLDTSKSKLEFNLVLPSEHKFYSNYLGHRVIKRIRVWHGGCSLLEDFNEYGLIVSKLKYLSNENTYDENNIICVNNTLSLKCSIQLHSILGDLSKDCIPVCELDRFVPFRLEIELYRFDESSCFTINNVKYIASYIDYGDEAKNIVSQKYGNKITFGMNSYHHFAYYVADKIEFNLPLYYARLLSLFVMQSNPECNNFGVSEYSIRLGSKYIHNDVKPNYNLCEFFDALNYNQENPVYHNSHDGAYLCFKYSDKNSNENKHILFNMFSKYEGLIMIENGLMSVVY